MSFGQMRDIGAWLKAYVAMEVAAVVITAGAGNDGVEVDGAWFPVGSDHTSAMLIIGWVATLVDTKTLTLTANIQDATALAGTGAADFGEALAATVVATGQTGDTVESGTTCLQLPEFNGNRGFIRSQITADLSATGTDTVSLSAILVCGGMADLPDGPGGLQTSV